MHTIIPGKGLTQLPIGSSTAQTVKMLGPASNIVSFEDEKRIFEAYKYDVNEIIPFQVGFDEVYQYQDNQFAIWKVYFSNGKAIYFNHSAFIFPDTIYQQITLLWSQDNILSFDDPATKVEDALQGEEYEIQSSASGSDDYICSKKGVELVINEGLLKNIMVFSPLV